MKADCTLSQKTQIYSQDCFSFNNQKFINTTKTAYQSMQSHSHNLESVLHPHV